MGSGGKIDVTCISIKGAEYMRNLKTEAERIFYKPGGYKFPIGDTPVMKTVKIVFEKVEKMEEEDNKKPEKMEIMS